MSQFTQQRPFPAWLLSPKIRAAVNEATAVTQAPQALVASSALAAASLSVQAKYDVERLNGLVSPCSLYFITFAESGERKTTVDKMFFNSFSEFEKSISKSSHEDGCTNEGALESAMKKTNEIRLIYSDTTPAAFLRGLHEHSRSAGLCEDEAGRIFNSRLVEDLGLLNKLWNGSDIRVDRKNESFRIHSARCTISWMVQPDVFRKFMEKKGESARGIGFLARCLVSYPPSTQGTRFLRRLPENLDAVQEFGNRTFDLLKNQVGFLRPENNDTSARTILNFSAPAQIEWERIFNNIEYATRPGGEFCEARDYASKVAENIARLAGVFHSFEGYEGTTISVETLMAAADVVLWYTQEFIELFSPPDPLHEATRDAYELENWLIRLISSRGWYHVPTNFILQHGPNKLRNRERLEWALNCIVTGGRACFFLQGKKRFINLNPAFFEPRMQGQEPIGFLPLG